MINADTDFILREWARWAKRRSWSSATCASAEKFYTPELGEVWEESHTRPLPIDARQAWKVECIWRTVEFKHRMVVRAYYITSPSVPKGTLNEAWRMHKVRTCRTVGIRPAEFDRYVQRGSQMIYNRLRKLGIANTISSVVPSLGRERTADRPPQLAALSSAEE